MPEGKSLFAKNKPKLDQRLRLIFPKRLPHPYKYSWGISYEYLPRWPESTEKEIIKLYMFVSYYFHKYYFYTSQTKKCLNSRSSHQRCSIEKSVFKNIAIFTGKHLCQSLLLIDLRASRPATFLKKVSNTGKHLCWSPFLRKLQVLKPANLLKGECCKIFKNTILVKLCEQLLLQFLLLTVNISFWVLVSALNSIGLLQRSSSRFKKFSLGCLVVGSPFI